MGNIQPAAQGLNGLRFIRRFRAQSVVDGHGMKLDIVSTGGKQNLVKGKKQAGGVTST